MEVRFAALADAVRICEVVRASITDLCDADHAGEPEVLARWLSNKTPDNVVRWLSNPCNATLVVVDEGCIVAAGCVNAAGEVILNYVDPAARFRGASSALLVELESVARRKGNTHCTLQSTMTAHRFYQKRGYSDVATPSEKHGLTVYAMARAL